MKQMSKEFSRRIEVPFLGKTRVRLAVDAAFVFMFSPGPGVVLGERWSLAGLPLAVIFLGDFIRQVNLAVADMANMKKLGRIIDEAIDGGNVKPVRGKVIGQAIGGGSIVSAAGGHQLVKISGNVPMGEEVEVLPPNSRIYDPEKREIIDASGSYR